MSITTEKKEQETVSREFKEQIDSSLNEVENVYNTVKSAFNNQSLNNLNINDAALSVEKITSMIMEQIETASKSFKSLGLSGVLGNSEVDTSLSSSLSSVINMVTCSMSNVNESMSNIKKLTQQVEQIKDSLQKADIDKLKTQGK